MNKRGFTLVELLAVIVILSLLTLLTSTAVTKLVKDAKNDLNSTQIELIKSAAQTWGADNLTGLPEAGKCSYLTLANLKDYGLIDSNTKDLNTNEKFSEDLKIKISTKRNEKSGKLITTYEVNPESIEGCYQQIYNNGEVVYFDVTTGKSCTNYKEENSKTEYNGFDGTEPQNGCLKFYAFLDSGRKLNLLLDHNLIGDVQWTDNSDSCDGGPKEEFLQELNNSTKDWIGTENLQNYVNSNFNANYVIKYNDDNYKARLISLEEVLQITNNSNFILEEDDDYYFDTNTDKPSSTCTKGNTTGCKYSWLYDRTGTDCTTYGCLNNSDENGRGYWTSSAQAMYAYFITYEGSIYLDPANGVMGIRPVIEVLKSNL